MSSLDLYAENDLTVLASFASVGAASTALAASAVRLLHCYRSCARNAQLVTSAVRVARCSGGSAPGARTRCLDCCGLQVLE